MSFAAKIEGGIDDSHQVERSKRLANVRADRGFSQFAGAFRADTAPRRANTGSIVHERARARAIAAEFGTNRGCAARRARQSPAASRGAAVAAAVCHDFSGNLAAVVAGIAARTNDAVVAADGGVRLGRGAPARDRERNECAQDEPEPAGFRRADPHFV